MILCVTDKYGDNLEGYYKDGRKGWGLNHILKLEKKRKYNKFNIGADHAGNKAHDSSLHGINL